MKTAKRFLGIFLAVLLMVSVPVTAFAETYDLSNGWVDVYGYEDGRYVYQDGMDEDHLETTETIITGGSGLDNGIYVYAVEDDVAVTLQDVSGSGDLELYAYNGDITVTVNGENSFAPDDWYTGVQIYGGYNSEEEAHTVTFTGSGSLDAVGDTEGIYSYNTNIVIDGPNISGTGSVVGVEIFTYEEYGEIGVTVNSGSLTGTSNFEISDEDYASEMEDRANEYPYYLEWCEYSGTEPVSLEEYTAVRTAGIALGYTNVNVQGGTVTGEGNSNNANVICHGIYTENCTLSVADGMVILDGSGNDITAAALADPSFLNNFAKATITAPAEAPAGDVVTVKDGAAEIQILGAYYGTKFEKSGEPDAAAMEKLSAGIDGECIYKGSFAFTDELEKHGTFQINFILPEYAGQHVIVATLDADGSQVTYDRWVGDNGIVSILNIDHLGDFAIFLA